MADLFMRLTVDATVIEAALDRLGRLLPLLTLPEQDRLIAYQVGIDDGRECVAIVGNDPSKPLGLVLNLEPKFAAMLSDFEAAHV